MSALQFAVLFLIRVLGAEETSLSPSKIKAAGDQALSKGKYDEAVKQYSALIAAEPLAKNYYKRASVYLRQRKYSQALPDLDKAIELDPAYLAVYGHRARAHLLRGSCQSAYTDYQVVLKDKPTDKKAVEGAKKASECIPLLLELDRQLSAKNWEQARQNVATLLETCSESRDLMMTQAKCDSELKDYQSVIVHTRSLLKLDKMNLEGLELRARAYFYMLEHESALNHVKEGLRLDPEHLAFKKLRNLLRKVEKLRKAAEDAIAQKMWQAAITSAKECLELSPDHKLLATKLALLLCRAYRELKEGQAAVDNCNKVLSHENNEEAKLGRAEAYIVLGQSMEDPVQQEAWFNKANADFQSIVEENHGHQQARQGLQRVQALIKRAKQKDYYKILGLKNDCTEREVKKAFRTLALIWHPDKHEENKDEAEAKFREIAEAHEILSDTETRGRYDRGEDLDEKTQQYRQPGFNFNGFNPFGGGQGNFHFKFG
eukprot:gb/GEZN01004473.1/.p1 GENE.gb/GEZN01004473.1/~~gb/GEZN01004473.1/.p1  ORF type:complete len:488 (-),score=97.20 gb/GEZN01004473.1/:398-1861(-)